MKVTELRYFFVEIFETEALSGHFVLFCVLSIYTHQTTLSDFFLR